MHGNEPNALYKWKVTSAHGNQPNTFQMGQRVNSHFVLKIPT